MRLGHVLKDFSMSTDIPKLKQMEKIKLRNSQYKNKSFQGDSLLVC